MPGHIVLEKAPCRENSRNSEGAMLRLRDGGIIFVYTHYCGGSDADEAGADLRCMISHDEGEHFTEGSLVLDHISLGALNIMSVSMLRMKDDSIGVFFLLRQSQTEMRMHLIRSFDEGQTWSKPVCCMPASGYYVVNNDRVRRLASGRIIIPAAMHRRGLKADGTASFDSRSEAVFFVSDDGLTWCEAQGKIVLPVMGVSHSGLQEPGIAELRPGLLWCWARTDLGRQYQAFSFDEGQHWTPAEPSGFTSPLSPLCAAWVDKRHLVTVWNPVPLYNGRPQRTDSCWHGGRSPLVLSVIDPKYPAPGKILTIEDDPNHGYCYTSIFAAQDGLLLSYCCGGPGDNLCLNRLRIRKINYKEMDIDADTGSL